MKGVVYFLLVVFISLGCTEYDYYKEVQTGVESGIRNDSLFLGYYFGMGRQEFFDYSWELNKQQKVKQGPLNRTIEYEINGLGDKVMMNFYPRFENETIAHMPVIFSYTAWAPWEKPLWSDKLILKIRDLLEQWYGIKFNLIRDINGTPGFVNISGNRRILITIKDDQFVNVLFTDMTVLDNPLDSLVLNKKYE